MNIGDMTARKRESLQDSRPNVGNTGPGLGHEKKMECSLNFPFGLHV
jgi:hypothetical protein